MIAYSVQNFDLKPNWSLESYKFIKALGAKTLLVGSRKEEKEIK